MHKDESLVIACQHNNLFSIHINNLNRLKIVIGNFEHVIFRIEVYQLSAIGS